ncbi:retrovirus-related pol polyprotein from transposon TNT 1-94 [Tanacetum coccineum]
MFLQRAKVTAIEESKDLSSLALDGFIRNLKVHEVVMEKDFEIYRGKKERVKSITLKAKKESSDDENLTPGSDDKEYAMVKGKNDRKFFRCGDPNHLIGDCPKPPHNKDQKAFIGGSWSDSENDSEDKTNDVTCLMAQSSNEVTLNFSYYSNNASSLDNDRFDSSKASTSGTKPINFVGSSTEIAPDGSTIKAYGSTIPGSVDPSSSEKAAEHVCLRTCLEPDERIKDSGCSKHMTGNKSLFSTYKAYDGEPKNVNEALGDESWVIAMQVELNQFVANDVWDLVPLPMSQTVRGTKWVFRNKLDENGIVSRNKARLVAQAYNQQEGIDYDETYAMVARLESIRILLAIACANDIKLYQMDVKSAFLNRFINEEQAHKAWYDRLKAFLIKHEYSMGMVDNTLFTKKSKSHLIIVQIYVDDIIFGSTCQYLCDDFAKIMHDEFEMSMMGELNFFLGLQIKQMEDGIFFNQSKYIEEMLKKFGLEDSKSTKMPMSMEIKLTKDDEADSVDCIKYRGMIGSLLYLTASTPDIMFSVCLCARLQENPKTTHLEAVKRIFRYIRRTIHLGLWYPKGTRIETIVYADSNHAGDYVDRKSTSGVCTFIGCCLTFWFIKKQTALAISTTKAEYVSAEKACQQALWMKQALIDYDIRLDDVPIKCDNKNAIDLSRNPVQHSRTKHIEIRHHFLRNNVQKGNISIENIASEDNIVDILTNP